MPTLNEEFDGVERFKTLRLFRSTGEFIAKLPVQEALQKYGDWIYRNGYAESFTEVSVWIARNTTK